MIKSWKWTDPLYDVLVVLLRGDGDAAIRWMDKTFGDVSAESVGSFAGAKTMWVERERGCAIVVWVPEWLNLKLSEHLSILAHESFHAAEFVLRERGMTLTDASAEAYAYYIAWIFRNCHQRLAA